MLNQRELLQAIAECESANENFQNCQKLATLYTIYDHLYPQAYSYQEPIRKETIEIKGNSEFLKKINGLDTDDVLYLVDEVMETIKILQPKLYDSVLRKLDR